MKNGTCGQNKKTILPDFIIGYLGFNGINYCQYLIINIYLKSVYVLISHIHPLFYDIDVSSCSYQN
uniref:Uncharacterized protein n=1 Tax=Glossina austeni TaxID=7395 RepID=A0A1A9UQS1_GLOAU